MQNRRDYAHAQLRRNSLHRDPLTQFEFWMQEALDAQLTDATAMALATADDEGRPSNRIVLLKSFDAEGFTWFTDYRSHKGADLERNPQAAVLFYWRELERQVRIEGAVSQVSRAQSEAYFQTRPELSRFAAAASHQSSTISDRETLEQAVETLRETYPQGDVPPPESWGGYRLHPERYEFWQGREGRLHDRFTYTALESEWLIERLQP